MVNLKQTPLLAAKILGIFIVSTPNVTGSTSSVRQGSIIGFVGVPLSSREALPDVRGY